MKRVTDQPLILSFVLAPLALLPAHGCSGGLITTGDGFAPEGPEEEGSLDPFDANRPDPDVIQEPSIDLPADEDTVAEPDDDRPDEPLLPYWIRSVGRGGSEQACCVDMTPDGRIVVGGSTDSFRGGDENFWVLTFDVTGSCLWQKYYGGDYKDEAYSLLHLPEGGHLVAGLSTFFDGNCLLIRVDDQGDILWQKMYLPVLEGMGFVARHPASGGFIAVGMGWRFLWAARLEDSGRTLWMRTYSSFGHPAVHSGQPLPEGGIVFAGKISSPEDGGEDILLFAMDGAGNILRQKALGGSGDEEAMGLHLLPEGDLILVGTVREHPAGSADAFVMRMASGSPVWGRVLGGADWDEARDVAHTPDGDLVVVGSTASFGSGGRDVWIMKLDGEGRVLWQRTYGGTGDDYASALKITPDGFIVAVGTTESFGAGESDVWILYLGPDGEVPRDCPAGMGQQSSAPIQDLVLEEKEAGFESESSLSFVIETDVVPVDTAGLMQEQCVP
jgi:uncharacterized delta-60 repeat protein